jgi:dTDP-L-rhamnose 4-epimerase
MISTTNKCTSAFLTGGAGFIGTHLTRALRAQGVEIAIYDSLHPQIHGDAPVVPEGDGITFVQGDVCDGPALSAALMAADPDVVFHLAAETGTGQSHDLISRYCDVNVGGTARLIEGVRALPPRIDGRGRRIVLASSRALYGEGAYARVDGTPVVPPARPVADLDAGLFDPTDADGMPLKLIPTTETMPPDPASIYASTKLMQEYVVRQGLAGSEIDAVVLRFQNVYGPGQTTRNPYTGVLSIFAAQAMAGKTLNIYEDGDIGRDFVFVSDVVDALWRAATIADAPDGAINIGSGVRSTILDAARQLLTELGKPADALHISGDYRIGDIRNAVADIDRARDILDWTPRVSLAEGIAALVGWLPDAR